MEFGIILLIIIYLVWVLLIKGLLWKIIIGVFGWFGIYVFLTNYISASTNECLLISNYSVSWAMIIPTLVLLLAASYTKED
jgi:hypothetical protein